MGLVHPVPPDVELFATFTIPQLEETDLRLCRGAGVWCSAPIVRLELRSVFPRLVQSICSVYCWQGRLHTQSCACPG